MSKDLAVMVKLSAFEIGQLRQHQSCNRGPLVRYRPRDVAVRSSLCLAISLAVPRTRGGLPEDANR